MSTCTHNGIQTNRINRNHAHTRRFRRANQFAHALVMTRSIHINLFNRRSFVAQTRRHGMKAEYHFFHCYRFFLLERERVAAPRCLRDVVASRPLFLAGAGEALCLRLPASSFLATVFFGATSRLLSALRASFFNKVRIPGSSTRRRSILRASRSTRL